MDIQWEDFSSNTGSATSVSLTDEGGYFWFFDPNNPEIIFNLYEGTANNGNWWYFFAGKTNVAYTVTVEDTLTGETRTYENSLGETLVVLDTGPIPRATTIPVNGGVMLLLAALGLLLCGLAALRFRAS